MTVIEVPWTLLALGACFFFALGIFTVALVGYIMREKQQEDNRHKEEFL